MDAPRSPIDTAASGPPDRLAQARRLLRLRTPLGDDALFAEDVEIWEGIGPGHGPTLEDGAPAEDADGMPPHPGPAPWPFDASPGPARAGLRVVAHALSDDAHLELKTLIGQPALVELLCQDSAADRRPWHGHIVAAALVGSDGGLARYRLVIEPWLSFLAHTVDAWSFQDMSVPRILDELFAGYAGRGRLAPAWRWDLADAAAYPRRSLCIQYHESDLDFAQRLMREEGLFCWWEHAGDAAGPGLGRHTLVIADHNGAFAPNPQPVVRFTASDHTLGEDSLVRWTDIARVTSARVALRSRDYRSLGDRPVEARVGAAGPDAPAAPLPGLAVVDVPGAYAYADSAHGQRLATRQAEALGARRRRALARGPWRRAQAGTSFTLADHPRHDGRDAARDTFVVLAAQHRARNDIAADLRARLGGRPGAPARPAAPRGASARDDAGPLHEAALLVQPLALPVRMAGQDPPPRSAAPDGRSGAFHGPGDAARADRAPPGPCLFDRHAVAALAQPDVRLRTRPTVRGAQTALIVGTGEAGAGADLRADRDGRVRVQFHWQRGSRSSHRLCADEGDNAPASAASGPWVRVGQSLAGANFGAVFIPRIGQEVLVDFIGGDIDRPVVVGVVYNGRGAPDAPGNQVAAGAAGASGNAPAWFPGGPAAGEPEGHRNPAVLLGHRSQELGSSATGQGGANQLIFDDSAGGNRIELSTSMQATRLQLGALLHQQGHQRLAPRGHGLDLATAAQGALRAGAGLLVSAHAQPPSTRDGRQLDTRAAQQALRDAQARERALAEAARAHGALRADAPAAPRPDPRADQGTGSSRPGAVDGPLPVERSLQALGDSLAATRPTAGAASAPAGAGPDGLAPGAGGGFGSAPAWGRPDLVLDAPAGIGLFTPAASVIAAGAQVALNAGQDINIAAAGHHATVAQAGVALYAHGRAADPARPDAETGIALHAANGSVHASSNTGATRLTAGGAVEVTSTRASVRVASPQRIDLCAAGAALRIAPGGITVQAPGAVRFKATMKDLTGPARAAPVDLRLPVSAFGAQAVYSQKVDLLNFIGVDAEHGGAYAQVPYTVRDARGHVVAQGVTGPTGETDRFYTRAREELHLFLGDGEWRVFAEGTGSPPSPADETPPPPPDDET